jgi:hypothetical protein
MLLFKASSSSGPHWLSWKVIALLSLLLWSGVVMFVVRERQLLRDELRSSHLLAKQGERRTLFGKASDDGHSIDVVISETISHNPKVKVVHDFLTEQECEQLIREGDGKLTPSYVVGKNGQNEANPSRSSTGTFLMQHTPFIKMLEERVARLSMLPVENQEAFYLLRYEEGQQYTTHPDYFSPDSVAAQSLIDTTGGQRVMTVVVYLNDVEQGGGTRFVHGGIDVKAKRGQALMWWDVHPVNGTGDANSWHAGLPVEKGVKYVGQWRAETVVVCCGSDLLPLFLSYQVDSPAGIRLCRRPRCKADRGERMSDVFVARSQTVPAVVLAVISCVIWLALFVLVWDERSAWHGVTNNVPVRGQGDASRALFEKESSDHHVLDLVISETISHNPRVKIFHDFLSSAECDALIREGTDKLTPSMVVGKDGRSEASSSRSSSGTFLTSHTEVIRRISQRIARVTMLPVENPEAFYLLRYEVGQQYATHPDYFAVNTPEAADVVDRMGGQRVATLIMYLNDVEAGGGTRFAFGGIGVKARRGQALFWWDGHPNGTVDANSWHMGEPVERGIKFVATTWIRERAFGTRGSTERPRVIH